MSDLSENSTRSNILSNAFWTCYFLLVALPFHGSNALISYFTLRGGILVFHLLFCIIAIFAVMLWLKNGAKIKLTFRSLIWGIFILCFTGSTLYGFYQYGKTAIEDASFYLLGILLYALSMSKLIKRKSFRELMDLTFYALTVNCGINIIMYLTRELHFWGLTSFNNGRYGGDYYTLLIITLPFALYDLLNEHRLKIVWVVLAYLFGIIGSLLLQSRTHVILTAFCCTFVLLYSVLLKSPKREYIGKLLSITVIIAGLICLIYKFVNGQSALLARFLNTSLGSSSDTLATRLNTAQYYLNQLSRYPFGCGFGRIMYYMFGLGELSLSSAGFYVDNAYVTVATKGGILLMIIYALLMLSPIKDLLGLRKRNRDPLLLVILLEYLCFLIAATILTSQVIHGYAVMTFAWCFISIANQLGTASRKNAGCGCAVILSNQS